MAGSDRRHAMSAYPQSTYSKMARVALRENGRLQNGNDVSLRQTYCETLMQILPCLPSDHDKHYLHLPSRCWWQQIVQPWRKRQNKEEEFFPFWTKRRKDVLVKGCAHQSKVLSGQSQSTSTNHISRNLSRRIWLTGRPESGAKLIITKTMHCRNDGR